MKKKLEVREIMEINRMKRKDMSISSNANSDGVSRREFIGATLA
jgi:hypothetical protein